MSSTHNLTYENFVRAAFSLETKEDVGRWGDPAKLANTDIFDAGYLSKIKASVSYSMCIFNFHVTEYSSIQDDQYDELHEKMDTILEQVFSADTPLKVYDLIEEYKNTFFNFIYQKSE